MERQVTLTDIYSELKRIEAAMITRKEFQAAMSSMSSPLVEDEEGELSDWAKEA